MGKTWEMRAGREGGEQVGEDGLQDGGERGRQGGGSISKASEATKGYLFAETL